MAKRSARKRRRGVGGPAKTERRVAPRPLPVVQIPEEVQMRAVMARTRVGAVMLAECPSFGVQPDFKRRDVIVQALPYSSIICPACGITLPVAEQTRCPKMQSGATAMKLLLPPEVLHAD